MLNGKLALMNGGTLEIDSPRPYSVVAAGLLKKLGVDPVKLDEDCSKEDFYKSLGLAPRHLLRPGNLRRRQAGRRADGKPWAREPGRRAAVAAGQGRHRAHLRGQDRLYAGPVPRTRRRPSSRG